MLTTAVVSILVVQNSLLCERKVQELKRAKFSTFPKSLGTLGLNNGPTIYMADKSAKLFLWLEWVMIINFRRGPQSYQLLVAAILDFFKIAASENEGIYFVSYLLIRMKYVNGSGVQCDVFGVKESEYDVQLTII